MRGFTIIELLVVAAIIGVLATLILPRYHSYTARSRRAEAAVNVGQLTSLLGIYSTEHDKYVHLPKVGYKGVCTSNQMERLGFKPEECSHMRYGYEVKNAGTKTFEIIAFAPSDAPGRWVYPKCTGAGAAECGETMGDKVRATQATGAHVCRDIVKYCPEARAGVYTPPACDTAAQCCDGNNVRTSCPTGQTLQAFPACCTTTTPPPPPPPPACNPATQCCDGSNVRTSCPTGQTLQAFPTCCTTTPPPPPPACNAATQCCDGNNVRTSCPTGQTLEAFPDCCTTTTPCNNSCGSSCSGWSRSQQTTSPPRNTICTTDMHEFSITRRQTRTCPNLCAGVNCRLTKSITVRHTLNGAKDCSSP